MYVLLKLAYQKNNLSCNY